jgi:hypothetical protein
MVQHITYAVQHRKLYSYHLSKHHCTGWYGILVYYTNIPYHMSYVTKDATA